jgi:ribonucleoside-diphosphate reductase alpha chain
VSVTSSPHPTRVRLPRARTGTTTSFQVAGTELFVTANGQPDGTLGEVFAKFGKEGSTTAGLMDLLSIAISLGLQHGVPPETFVRKFKGMRFEPMGRTDDPEIPDVASIGDYLARRIALDWLPFETRRALGVLAADEAEPRWRITRSPAAPPGRE